MINPESLGAGHQAVPWASEPVREPRALDRGLVVFDMDGTIFDDLSLISHVAADVLHQSFGTPLDEARIHYLATTGMPFEAQLMQLYPDSPADLRARVAQIFHTRKTREAYAHVSAFPEIPRVLKQLDRERWTLAISTGAEREVADLLLEREGLRIWFEVVLGSGQGTKREHLIEYRRQFPEARVFLVGDSRFDMEAARDTPGVTAIGRASGVHGWTLSPEDLRRWGAAWSDFSLAELPQILTQLESGPLPRNAHASRPEKTRRPERQAPSTRKRASSKTTRRK